MERKFKLNAAADYVGYNPTYLQVLDRTGILVARRTRTNRRYYLQSDLDDFLNEHSIGKNKKIIAYCRVSSPGQKQDLENQKTTLQQYCASKKYDDVEYVTEIGDGLNFHRKAFCKILKQIVDGEISTLIVVHKDRLCRFGFEMVQYIAECFCTHIEVLDTKKLSP